MQFGSGIPRTKTQIAAQIVDVVQEMIVQRLSTLEAKVLSAASLLDGVSLEELVNFSVPLTSQQTQDQLKDGVLLGYRDGKLVEEHDLNGGTF